ncbi:MAG: hypothetical protein GX616_02845 [Planctomycetes bacterium]|nr:hypothetical protein [Planctomycetota bacterium]
MRGDILGIADFDIDAGGRVQSLRSGQLWHWADSIRSDPALSRRRAYAWPFETTALDRDHYRMVARVFEPGSRGVCGLCRLDAKFDETGQLKLVSGMIVGEEFEPADSDSWMVYGSTWTDRYAYLLYSKYRKSDSGDNAGTQAEEEARRMPEQTVLRVYDWSLGSRGAKALEMILPAPCFFRRTTSSIVFHRYRFSSNIVGVAPLDDLQAIKDLFSGGMPEPRDWSGQINGIDASDVRENHASYVSLEEVTVRQDQAVFTVKADRKGLIVTEIGDNVGVAPRRAFRYSPLQSLFEGPSGRFQVVDSTLLAQSGFRAVRFYDLSDPFHARRVGFLNVSSADCPAFERIGEYLLFLTGRELTVVKRPKTRRAGTAIASDEVQYRTAVGVGGG